MEGEQQDIGLFDGRRFCSRKVEGMWCYVYGSSNRCVIYVMKRLYKIGFARGLKQIL